MTAALPHEQKHPAYTRGEEIANSVTHGIGSALAVAGLTLLALFGAMFGDGWALGSAIVYGVSMVLLYGASTLYHALPGPRAKHVFKVLDHSAIYVLIAGTYTPFALITLRSKGGLWLFAVIWGLAVLGIALEAAWVYRPKWLAALLYIGMGWLVVAMGRPLSAALSPPGLWLLLAGGLAYTLGTAFYVVRRVPFMHAVWHCFVLGGSVCHFMSVFLYVMPPAR